MPIDTKYKGYDLAIEKVETVRDFANGEFTVKSKGEKYLPRLGGQSNDAYNAYKLRGYVMPSVEPTSSAIIGSIMRRDPVMELGEAKYLIDNADGEGTDLVQMVSDMIKELNLAGGAGYLVEFDNELNKPVIKQYSKESIINQSKDFIVLSQEYSVPNDKDKFKPETKIEYLELTFDKDGKYIQNLWRQSKQGWNIVDVVEPNIRGEKLDFIPFVECTRGGKTLKNSDPILLHLASVNADQYRLSTDQRHGLHWTALPTMFLFGDIRDEDGKSKQVKVGAGSSNHIPDTDARAELLEFTGAGLSSIKSAVDDDINTMASIGATMLSSGGGGVRAAETARIEAGSETATLSTIANAVDNSMMSLLKIVNIWLGSKTESIFNINRDFIDIKLDAQTLTALVGTWQSGGMSLHSFLTQLEKGELLPKGITADDEIDRIGTTGADFAESN
jgi:hypothetical protein